MRIIKLEIQDFRAFYGNHIIEFAKEGERGYQNLLLYGENGSGKSSLMLAIQYVLESATKGLDFDDYGKFSKTDTVKGVVWETLTPEDFAKNYVV